MSVVIAMDITIALVGIAQRVSTESIEKSMTERVASLSITTRPHTNPAGRSIGIIVTIIDPPPQTKIDLRFPESAENFPAKKWVPKVFYWNC